MRCLGAYSRTAAFAEGQQQVIPVLALYALPRARLRDRFDPTKGGPMAGNSIKNKKKYKALKRKGMSKTRAAKIANAGKSASKKGGRKGGRKSKGKKKS